eukprot:CAMPEP_0176328010 /NCGR_PEP_ID=MMETSP0121_2-20121125/74743_1 /TAXON_ID=160619 /ORGANISM="Kryptoperidinium foliaceum, Strain CCMP 1326" /LENGTH=44 /DNA_ID= /DNA_START= /DNA_END= /DNA_ORIENTATION=
MHAIQAELAPWHTRRSPTTPHGQCGETCDRMFLSRRPDKGPRGG